VDTASNRRGLTALFKITASPKRLRPGRQPSRVGSLAREAKDATRSAHEGKAVGEGDPQACDEHADHPRGRAQGGHCRCAKV